jgi:hypothetical protein
MTESFLNMIILNLIKVNSHMIHLYKNYFVVSPKFNINFEYCFLCLIPVAFYSDINYIISFENNLGKHSLALFSA